MGCFIDMDKLAIYYKIKGIYKILLCTKLIYIEQKEGGIWKNMDITGNYYM